MSPGRSLCSRCRTALTRLHPPVCDLCGAPGPWPVRRCAECSGRRLAFVRARSAIAYDGRARSLVGAWKEGGRRGLARVAAEIVADVVPRPDVEGLVPVPGDPERAWRRGDVPPRALARELGRLWKLDVAEPLTRSRAVPRQRGLALDARRRNVRGSVTCDAIDTATVCIVDDVYTSGATGDACARALRARGVRRVEVVSLARALR